MTGVKIFSDSTCDLSPRLVSQYDIGIIPLYVNFGEKSYRDGIDITTPQLYQLVEKTGSLPSTAAASPGEIIAAFKPYVDAGREVLFIGISSELSATVNNARLAAAQLPEGKVTVVDSRNLSTGIGLLVLEAADLAGRGLGAEAIAAGLAPLIPNVETEFIIDTLEYLHKGGRCSGIARFVGSMLRIRPSIKVKDGRMYPAEKFRGSRKKALTGLLANALANRDKIAGRVFVTHSVSDNGPWLKEQLEQHTEAEVFITQAGCVISSHCGPNTIGILYIKK